ncbi:MAG TPA: ATP-binding cassette domain-containing protein [Candidatus Dormibacteraeota bacterium]|nr:ATP-binding cassette domain-containing protein [Candidatus Dormibacteraeota bacterium]
MSATAATPSRSHYIEFAHVYKTFERPALVDCSFYVDAKEALAILGPRGSGKSLILQLVMGFDRPDQGTIVACGQRIFGRSETEWSANDLSYRRNLSFITQSGMVLEALTAADNLRYPFYLPGDLTEEQQSQIISGLLQMGGLPTEGHLKPADLPVGQRRMLALLHGLAGRPECILFDEPTADSDPYSADALIHILNRLKIQLNFCMLLPTRDLLLTRKVADRVLFLDRGNVRFFGTSDEFFSSGDAQIQQFLRMEGY